MLPKPRYLVFLILTLACAKLAQTASRPNTQLLMGTYENHAEILNVRSLKVTTVFKCADPHGRQVTYDLKNKKVYWTGGDFGGIYWADFKGNNVRTFYNTSGADPDLIAYDWIGKNLYITGRYDDLLTICKGNDPSKCASISIPQMRWAGALTLNPLEGIMFWTTVTDFNEDKIYRSEMDGTNVTLIRENVGTSYGLVYDFTGSNRLFWTTRDYETIESSDINGEDHRILAFSPGGSGKIYYGISLYYDTVFWSDRLSQTIYSVNKTTIRGAPTKVYEGSKEDFIYTIAVIDSSNQPTTKTNTCARDPCSHICALKRHSFSCLCPMGMRLTDDKRTCVALTSHRRSFQQLAEGTMIEASSL